MWGGGGAAGSKAILNLWNFAAASRASGPACYLLKTHPKALLGAWCAVLVYYRTARVPAPESALIGRYLISMASTICNPILLHPHPHATVPCLKHAMSCFIQSRSDLYRLWLQFKNIYFYAIMHCC